MKHNTNDDLVTDMLPLSPKMDAVEAMAYYDALPKPFREYVANYPYLINVRYDDNLKALISEHGIEKMLKDARDEDVEIVRESAELAYGPEHPEAKVNYYVMIFES